MIFLERRKDSNTRKIFSGFIDERTLMALYKLSNKGVFDVLIGVVKRGKESNVLIAEDKNGKKFAVKVYAVESSNFKNMHKYLIGDRRFSGIKKNRRSIVYAWCRREYKNLMRAYKAGVRCPKPIAFYENVLVMEFLGKGIKPYPRLADIISNSQEVFYKRTIANMKKMYRKAGLVHGDLSEFNILTDGRKIWFIDFSHAVPLDNNSANYLLKRDVGNICRFFSRYLDCSKEEILNIVTGKN